MTPLAIALGVAFVVAAIAVADTAGWVRMGEPRRLPPRRSPDDGYRMTERTGSKKSPPKGSRGVPRKPGLTTLVNEAKATPDQGQQVKALLRSVRAAREIIDAKPHGAACMCARCDPDGQPPPPPECRERTL